jgi:hypothetical protein
VGDYIRIGVRDIVEDKHGRAGVAGFDDDRWLCKSEQLAADGM